MQANFRNTSSLALTITFFLACTVTVHADGAGYNTGGSTLTVGGGVLVKPKYEGSEEYEVIGFPMAIPSFSGDGSSQFGQLRNRVTFRGIEDIRFRALGSGPFEFGPVTGYRTGRDEDDADRLRGLGDIDGGLVLGGYAAFRLGSVQLDASAATQLTGDETGVQLRFGAETVHRYSPGLEVTTRVGTTLASDEYMENFFGISARQSALSAASLPQYEAEAGLKDVHVAIGAKADLNDRWVVNIGGRYARLIGDAADSPVVESEDQFSGMLGLAYKFSIDR